ncbi:SusC/RagA family TonB-linked outer membrane protein [Bacteroides sp. 224]|uniref:SusC/RagA family TonB-linked outer membrane protein n=1 Tax=Bacteroides sp. 224 TaxID=2302936 RepID=UPI0013D058BB|nr:SusC/RagA family TonB-linked outer membrane protein [Bacteroides sp. 224]
MKILQTIFLLFICTATFSQEMRIVSGVISDNDGEPIVGCNVVQKDTANGTLTDVDGYYEITAPLGSTIQFRFIGMKTSEMVISLANSKPATNRISNFKFKQALPQKEKDTKEEKDESLKVTGYKEDQSLSPYFLIKSSAATEAHMPLKQTNVEANIAGVIADVCVKQIYINESENTLEAIYVFPGSTRAAVYGMAMTIGDRRIEAKIKKKEQARQEYEKAKEEGKSTTLLEQHRPNVFQMNVANILPGDTIVVEMKYTELLENEDKQYEFVYPTVVGPRYSESGEQWVDRSINQLESDKTPGFFIRTTIQAGMPIRKISSMSHNLTIESPSPDQAVVSLSNPKDYQGDRDYILQYELQGGKVESGLLRYEHGDENFFLLMVQPPKKPSLNQIPPREYVFIIDVSGSMGGTPLDISKKLIYNLVTSLRPIDRFNVMLFESSNAMLYEESLPATEENIEKAMNVIDRRQGSGGTRLYPALVNAMNFKATEGYSRTFMVITDGFVTVEKEAFNYVRDHLNEANLFPFGIGMGVNRYIIEGLAHAGMGTPYIVSNFFEAEKVGQKAINEISEPVLTNISVDWDEFDVYDVEPVGIPDVFAERPILIYGKYKGEAKGTITLSGLSGEENYRQTFDVAKARQENNRALRYLWARNQIRYFDDYAQYYEGDTNGWSDMYGRHQRSPRQIEYVTNLGLKYNLLTQYTSFLAVDEEVRTPKQVEPVSAGSYKRSSGKSYSSKKRSSSPSPTNVTTPNIQLAEEASVLEEVVVSSGVIRRNAVGFVASCSTVSGTRIQVSPSLHLQGRVPGLQIAQTAGEPGDASRVRIRGGSSIMDNNEPLVVVDGVPVEYSALSQMNANDINDVTVLKDASATTIYGSRATNGVLLVTTKKPAYKNQSITWSSSFTVDTPNKLPELQREYAQGRPWNGTPLWNTEDEPFAWGPDVQSVNAPTYDAYDILETGYSLKNHLSFSGREGNYYYNFKVGNITQQGFIPKSKFSANSMGLRIGADAIKKISFDVDLKYKKTEGNRLQRGYNLSSVMRGILLTPPTFDNREWTLDDGSQRSAGSAADNPYWSVKNNAFSDEADRFTGSFNLKYKPTEMLSLNYLLSADYLSGEASSSLNEASVYRAPGQTMKREEEFKSIQSKLYAELRKSWDRVWINTMLGYEYNRSKRTIDRLDSYTSQYYPSQEGVTDISFERLYKRYSNAAFGKVSVGYEQIVTLEAAMRGEWSSINHIFLSAPSVGLNINLNRIIQNDTFSELRLRANVSRADKEIPLYMDPTYFNSTIYNLNDGASHFESREIKQESLKPETITHYEVGASIGLLNHRLTLSPSFYWKRGKDQLLPTQTVSYFLELENCGRFKTHGFELELSAWLMRRRKFSWNTEIIFSRERSRVTDLGGRKLMLAGVNNAVGAYAIEGQPLGVLYGTAYLRDEQGNMIIGPNGFPIVDYNPQVLGNPNPDWQLSWIHSLEYRNFSLSLSLDYKKGGKMWNGTRNTMNYYGTSQYSADHRNTTGYVFPGVSLYDGSVNDIPVNFNGDYINQNRWTRYGEYGVGEDGIEDASYIKLREISLGYRIPLKLFQRNTQLKLSIFATNILLFSKYKGVDPETNLTGASNGFGLDYFNIPGSKSIGMSLNWEF